MERQILGLAQRPGEPSEEARRIRAVLLLLASMGTRANGARKLQSLELWEVRAGRHRLFFSPVPGTHKLAVGALIVKEVRRIKMSRLRHIEHKVHIWRDALRADR